MKPTNEEGTAFPDGKCSTTEEEKSVALRATEKGTSDFLAIQ